MGYGCLKHDKLVHHGIPLVYCYPRQIQLDFILDTHGVGEIE